MVPIQLRAGGAFITLAAALFLFTVLTLLRGEELFAMTLQTVTVLIAAVIIGAFATVSTSQEGSRTQVGALIVALVLIGLGVALPTYTLFYTQAYWPALWGIGSLLCAIVLRRTTPQPR